MMSHRSLGAPPQAVARIKHAIYGSHDADLATMLEVERENQLACFGTEDVKRGLVAFRNKETPRFEGD